MSTSIRESHLRTVTDRDVVASMHSWVLQRILVLFVSKKYLSRDGNFAKDTRSSKAQNSHPSMEEASGYFEGSGHKGPGHIVK